MQAWERQELASYEHSPLPLLTSHPNPHVLPTMTPSLPHPRTPLSHLHTSLSSPLPSLLLPCPGLLSLLALASSPSSFLIPSSSPFSYPSSILSLSFLVPPSFPSSFLTPPSSLLLPCPALLSLLFPCPPFSPSSFLAPPSSPLSPTLSFPCPAHYRRWTSISRTLTPSQGMPWLWKPTRRVCRVA